MPMILTRRSILAVGMGLIAAPVGVDLANAAGSGQSLERIKAAGAVRIGVEGTFPPFSFRQDGKLVGYDVDLAAVLFKELGVKQDFIDTQWSGVVLALLAGNFDLIMSSLSYTKERMAKVAYSIPYADSSQALLVRAADEGKVKSLDDLSGKPIGLKAGSPEEVSIIEWGKKVEANRGAGFAEVKTFDSDPALFLALAQGTVDGAISNITNLGQIIKQAPGVYTVVPNIAGNSYAGIGLRKDELDLKEYLDSQLLAATASGVLGNLQEKWFGFKFDLPKTVPAL